MNFGPWVMGFGWLFGIIELGLSLGSLGFSSDASPWFGDMEVELSNGLLSMDSTSGFSLARLASRSGMVRSV